MRIHWGTHVVRRTKKGSEFGGSRLETSTNASPSYPTHHPVAVRHIRWHPSSTCRKNHQNISSLKPSPRCVALRDGQSMGCWQIALWMKHCWGLLTRKFRDNFRSQKRKIEWSSMWQYIEEQKKQTSGWIQNCWTPNQQSCQYDQFGALFVSTLSLIHGPASRSTCRKVDLQVFHPETPYIPWNLDFIGIQTWGKKNIF